MKLFIGFVFISGIGWLLDCLSYWLMTQTLIFPPSYANFISSLIGVTYVWIVAIKSLFKQNTYSRSIYLPIYWLYHAMSIFGYSALISIINLSSINSDIGYALGINQQLTAKLLLTPPNLLTNFIFMRLLTLFMKASNQGQAES